MSENVTHPFIRKGTHSNTRPISITAQFYKIALYQFVSFCEKWYPPKKMALIKSQVIQSTSSCQTLPFYIHANSCLWRWQSLSIKSVTMTTINTQCHHDNYGTMAMEIWETSVSGISNEHQCVLFKLHHNHPFSFYCNIVLALMWHHEEIGMEDLTSIKWCPGPVAWHVTGHCSYGKPCPAVISNTYTNRICLGSAGNNRNTSSSYFYFISARDLEAKSVSYYLFL